MSYDLFVDLCSDSRSDVRIDIPTHLKLLAGIAARGSKEDAVRRYISLIHGSKPSTQTEASINGLFAPVVPDLTILPLGSWFLQFIFTLAKPWLSKDDDPFYVADSVNPVRKDKVFKVPLMPASAWKGLLRWTAMRVRLFDEPSPESFAEERFRQALLFGDEKGGEPESKEFAAHLRARGGEEADGLYRQKVCEHYGIIDSEKGLPRHAGRLMLYPTFFSSIDVEVINPHKRETKAGTHPIYLECVPDDAKGTFSLLYVPFDLIGQDEAKTRSQAAKDLRLVAEAISAMMLTYGFSAKRSSGYGTAKESVENGVLQIRVKETAPPQPPVAAIQAPSQPLPKYLAAPGRLKDEYLNPDGTFRGRSPAELNAMAKAQRQEYEKAKKWWEREGQSFAEQTPAEPQPKAAPPAAQWFRRDFSTFAELLGRAREAEILLQKGGAQ